MGAPELSPRDRSLVTLAALIARAQTSELPYYVGQALDNGVNPREISEVITHLSFYASRANALSAAAVVRQVFAERKIGADQLPAAEPKLLALDEVNGGQACSACERVLRFNRAGVSAVHH